MLTHNCSVWDHPIRSRVLWRQGGIYQQEGAAGAYRILLGLGTLLVQALICTWEGMLLSLALMMWTLIYHEIRFNIPTQRLPRPLDVFSCHSKLCSTQLWWKLFKKYLHNWKEFQVMVCSVDSGQFYNMILFERFTYSIWLRKAIAIPQKPGSSPPCSKTIFAFPILCSDSITLQSQPGEAPPGFSPPPPSQLPVMTSWLRLLPQKGLWRKPPFLCTTNSPSVQPYCLTLAKLGPAHRSNCVC